MIYRSAQNPKTGKKQVTVLEPTRTSARLAAAETRVIKEPVKLPSQYSGKTSSKHKSKKRKLQDNVHEEGLDGDDEPIEMTREEFILSIKQELAEEENAQRREKIREIREFETVVSMSLPFFSSVSHTCQRKIVISPFQRSSRRVKR